MRKSLLFATAAMLLVTGCSQKDERNNEMRMDTVDVSEPAPASPSYDMPPPPPPPIARDPAAMRAPEASGMGAPNVSVTAAPGVAFNYRYAFRLPNNRIAAVQEAHAQACEKLGIAKCRITGMRYNLVDGEDVRAMLAFKLSPEIARQFGKDGIAAVTDADGMLVDSEISGVDEGSAIKASTMRSAELKDRLNAVEKQLRAPGLKNADRVLYQNQADNLRRQMQGENQSRSDSEEALANTPMVFHYGSGSSIPGFDGSSPFKDSWRAATHSFATMLGMVLLGVGVSLPWLLLAGLLVALWRSALFNGVRRWLWTREVERQEVSPRVSNPEHVEGLDTNGEMEKPTTA